MWILLSLSLASTHDAYTTNKTTSARIAQPNKRTSQSFRLWISLFSSATSSSSDSSGLVGQVVVAVGVVDLSCPRQLRLIVAAEVTTALLMVESIDCDRKLVAACEAETVCRRATGFFTHVELFFLFCFLFFCFFVYYFFPTVEWEWMKFSIHSFHSGFLVIHSHSVPFHSILVHPYQIRLHNFSIQPYATPGTRLTYKIQCLSEAKSNIDHSISEERNRKKLNKI